MTHYIDTENGTPGNALHWTMQPLDADVVAVLQSIDETGRLRDRDRFNIAYLVARGCLHVNLDAEPMTFKITAKGYDALAFYVETVT